MTSMQPCAWPVEETCLPAQPPDADPQIRRQACDQAVMILWALSGRQFGACPTRVRPCPNNCWPQGRGWGSPLIVAWDGAHWLNMACGCLGGSCVHTGPAMVHLPGPVSEILQVSVGDTVLGDNEYRAEGDVLYRLGAPWPNQNLGAPVETPGTWYVDYLRGYPPPPGAGRMVALLATELINQCTSGTCRLPRSVRRVTRNGVAYDVYDPGQMYTQGKTGIPEIDMWLAAVNPNHLPAAPSVL